MSKKNDKYFGVSIPDLVVQLNEAWVVAENLRSDNLRLQKAVDEVKVIILRVANGIVGIIENEGMDTAKYISNQDASIEWLAANPKEEI